MWIRTLHHVNSDHSEEEQFINLDTGCQVQLAVWADNTHSANVLYPAIPAIRIAGERAIDLRILMSQLVEATKEAVGIKEAA